MRTVSKESQLESSPHFNAQNCHNDYSMIHIPILSDKYISQCQTYSKHSNELKIQDNLRASQQDSGPSQLLDLKEELRITYNAISTIYCYLQQLREQKSHLTNIIISYSDEIENLKQKLKQTEIIKQNQQNYASQTDFEDQRIQVTRKYLEYEKKICSLSSQNVKLTQELHKKKNQLNQISQNKMKKQQYKPFISPFRFNLPSQNHKIFLLQENNKKSSLQNELLLIRINQQQKINFLSSSNSTILFNQNSILRKDIKIRNMRIEYLEGRCRLYRGDLQTERRKLEFCKLFDHINTEKASESFEIIEQYEQENLNLREACLNFQHLLEEVYNHSLDEQISNKPLNSQKEQNKFRLLTQSTVLYGQEELTSSFKQSLFQALENI